MTTEAETIQRRVSEAVREMLNEYRLQAHVGPVTEQALEQIVFRAARPIVDGLMPGVLLPNVVRLLLAACLEAAAGAPDSPPAR